MMRIIGSAWPGLVWALGVGIAVLPAGAETNAPPAVVVAKPAPAFVLHTLAAQPLKLADFQQPVLVVVFFSTSDRPSQRQIAILNEVRKELTPEQVEIIGISVDEIPSATLREYGAAQGIGFPLCKYTYNVVQQFGGLEAVPTSFVIDHNRNIIHHAVGVADQTTLLAYARAVQESHALETTD